jgi:hypothetical protein
MSRRNHLEPDKTDLRLGRLAVRANLITEEQLQAALFEQAREMAPGRLHRPLGLILVSLGFLSVDNLANLLGEQERLMTKSQ